MNNGEIISYDLQDFNDLSLSSAGELEVSPNFRHPIHIQTGTDSLELTRIELPSENNADGWQNPDMLFVLRNLNSESEQARITLDNVRRNLGNISLKGVDYEVLGRSTLIVGRETTPELDLSASTSRRHLQIRIGNMAGNLHFADLYSTNGTIVNIHEEDARRVNTNQRRYFTVTDSKEIITREQQDKRWSR